MSKKPVNVAPAGDAATVDKTPVSCMVCCEEVPSAAVLSCARCKCGSYCSVVCLAQHDNHAQYCPSICSLERIETEKRIKNEIFVSDAEKLPFKMKLKLVKLVGERPLVKVKLNGKDVTGLWDTGAMISLINKGLLHELFPDAVIHSISDFTGENFTLTVANRSVMPVCGVVVLDFGVGDDEQLFRVPFLVTSEDISSPIIGYNTIEHLVSNFKDKIDLSKSLANVYDVSVNTVESMVNLIQNCSEIAKLNSEAKLEKIRLSI